MKFIVSFATAVMLFWTMNPLSASEGENLDRVFEAVFDGHSVEKLSVYNHRWNFTHLVNKTRDQSGNVRIQGYFRHYKKWNFDDKIRFDFTIRYGEVMSHKIEIKKKGYANYLTLGIADIMYEIFKDRTIAGDTLNDMLDEIDSWNVRSWEQAAQKISVMIVLEAYSEDMPLRSSLIRRPRLERGNLRVD